MEPKFQSSFIPKGPISSTATALPARRTEEKSLLSFLAFIIFAASVLLAMGMFGYKFYLKYRIGKMGADLASFRATLQPETIRELTRLNDRIISTKDLLSKHRALTPLFKFLELSTPKTARLNNFHYSMTGQGLELSLDGEARGYAALALLADVFNKSQYFKDSIFSDLNLNERGDVSFSFKAMVEPNLVSYDREVERIGVPKVLPVGTVATSTASTSTSTATSASTSSPQATPN